MFYVLPVLLTSSQFNQKYQDRNGGKSANYVYVTAEEYKT